MGKQYVMGEQFNCADAYLFTTLGWLGHAGLDLARWPVLEAYHERIAARPRVIDAMQAEGVVG